MTLTCSCVRAFVLSSRYPTLQLDYKNERKISNFESFVSTYMIKPPAHQAATWPVYYCTCQPGFSQNDAMLACTRETGMGLRYNALYTQSLVLHGNARKSYIIHMERPPLSKQKMLFIHIPITTAIAI